MNNNSIIDSAQCYKEKKKEKYILTSKHRNVTNLD